MTLAIEESFTPVAASVPGTKTRRDKQKPYQRISRKQPSTTRRVFIIDTLRSEASSAEPGPPIRCMYSWSRIIARNVVGLTLPLFRGTSAPRLPGPAGRELFRAAPDRILGTAGEPFTRSVA